jgi:hypothetical protein
MLADDMLCDVCVKRERRRRDPAPRCLLFWGWRCPRKLAGEGEVKKKTKKHIISQIFNKQRRERKAQHLINFHEKSNHRKESIHTGTAGAVRVARRGRDEDSNS